MLVEIEDPAGGADVEGPRAGWHRRDRSPLGRYLRGFILQPAGNDRGGPRL